MIKNICKKIYRKFQVNMFPSLQDNEIKKWYKDGAERTRRLEYSLAAGATVLDLGGYEGQWASDIFSMNPVNIHIFEAVPEYANNIQKRFINNKMINVYPFALGAADGSAKISLGGPGSSMFRGGGTIDVVIKDASRLFDICGISHCDLLKINIEGGEYEVFPRLFNAGLINKIDNIQIQFHNIDAESHGKMMEIRKMLSGTHKVTWQYTWVWENWKKVNN